MIEGLAARWLLNAVFGAVGLTEALPRRGLPESAQWVDRVSAVFCGGMCAALIAMTWRSEPAAATWLQAAVFGCAALGFGLASVAGIGPVRRPRLPALFHALMAGAMIWMLTAMPAAAGSPSARSPRGAMAPMSQAATLATVVAVSIVLALSCAAASIPWLARAIGAGPRGQDPLAAGHRTECPLRGWHHARRGGYP